MGKEKSAVQSKLKNQKVKSNKEKKLLSGNKKEVKKSDDVDSLIFLKDTRKKKELDGLDEKFNLLKSELKTLFSVSKSECQNSELTSFCDSTLDVSDLSLSAIKQSDSLDLELDKKNETNKFSTFECLNETVDLTTETLSTESKNFKQDPVFNESTLLTVNTKNSYILSQHEIEQLIYKSFYLQNYNVYLSSSDEENNETVKPSNSRKLKRKTKTKNFGQKKSNTKKVQSNKSYRNSYRGRKKRRISSGRNVQIIDIDINSTSDDNRSRSYIDLVDLDVTEYDWSESFDLEENSESLLQKSFEKTYEQNNQATLSNTSPENNTNNVNNSKKLWECPICLEHSTGQDIVATQCGHTFCKICLEKHTSKCGCNCPTCRTDLTNKPPITLYNF